MKQTCSRNINLRKKVCYRFQVFNGGFPAHTIIPRQPVANRQFINLSAERCFASS